MEKELTRGRLLRPLEVEVSAQDLDLIRQLQSDGRASHRELSAKTAIPERSIGNRIADLREKGAMEITIVADPRRLGYPSMALLGIRAEQHEDARVLAERLFAVSGVDYAVTVGGRFDILAEVVAKTDADLFDIVSRQIKGCEGVDHVELFPLLRLHHQQLFWDAAQRKRGAPPKAPEQQLDSADWGIIKALSNDGRTSFLEVSRNLGVSESHVRTRFGKLNESGLIRVIALTNPRLFGYGTNAWLCINVSGDGSVVKVADHLAALPHVTYVAISSGGFDVMAEIVCKDKDELLDLIDNRIRQHCPIARAEILLCYDFLYRKVSYGEAV